MEYLQFYDGSKVPVLGFGTYKIDPADTKEAVLNALSSGYRLVDTAQDYENEAEVGQAVRECGIPRDKVFVTTKQDTGGYERAKKDIDGSLLKAGLDYFDLMIIHWPTGKDVGTYQALEEAVKAGKLRYIGVSNFNIRQLEDLMKQTSIKPVVNQIETSVYNQQVKQHDWLTKQGIIHEAWSPLASGPKEMMSDQVLQEIGQKYGKTAVQIALKVLVQEKVWTIPRSVNPEHIKDNIDLFDFELTDNEMAALRKLDKKQWCGWPKEMSEDLDY